MWKRKQLWPDLKYYLSIGLERMRKSTKKRRGPNVVGIVVDSDNHDVMTLMKQQTGKQEQATFPRK